MKINVVDATFAQLNEPLTIRATTSEIVDYLKDKSSDCTYFQKAEIQISKERAVITQIQKCNLNHPLFSKTKLTQKLNPNDFGIHYINVLHELKLLDKPINLHQFDIKNNKISCVLSYQENWENLNDDELYFYYANQHIKRCYKNIKKVIDQSLISINTNTQRIDETLNHLYLKIIKAFQKFNESFKGDIDHSDLMNLEIDDFRYIIQHYFYQLLNHIESNYQQLLDNHLPVPINSHLRNTEVLSELVSNFKKQISVLSNDLRSLLAFPLCILDELDKCPQLSFTRCYHFLNFLQIWNDNEETLTEEKAIALCIKSNLNTNQIIEYIYSFIKNALYKKESYPAKKLELHRYIKTIKQIHIQNKESYIPENKNLKKHILKWLKEELTFVDKILEQSVTLQIPESKTSVQLPKEKLNINLTIPEIALFFRLMVETNLLQAPTRTQIFDFITDNLKTETSDNLSKASIKNKFYSPENTSFETVKKALINMLDVLKRDL